MDGGSGRYAAFLSYSHKDAAAARWLHRKLEIYRIPRRLVGKEGERGPVPARLTPIFRDREELPAAGDLSERVRAALAASDNLVTLCSPNGAASPWVAKEIAAFRELHPDRPVFAAIVEGEPPLCFPSNLAATAGAEPLAADLRPHADGRRLGFLKLVAGLSGIGLDALVQRDAQRRLRRVTAVTAAALMAMLVMAVLTGIALSQRREAQRQRAEAEGLVEFMLTDLRKSLKGVGRLDVLGAVNERALAYYQRQDLSRLADDSLARRARIFQAMGEDDEKFGHISRVLAEAQEASRTTSALLAKKPNDPQRIFDDAQSAYWVGRVHELRSDWRAAQRQYVLYAADARRLIAIAPHNPDYMMEMGWSAGNIGAVQLSGARNYPAAQASFEKAIYWFGEAVRSRPSDSRPRMEQANYYAWLADSFHARRLWHDALKSRVRQYEILAGLHRNQPHNVELEYRSSLAEFGVGSAFLQTGDVSKAKAFLLAAHKDALSLTARDPKNAEWLLFRAKTECALVNPTLRLSYSVTSALRKAFGGDVAILVDTKSPRLSEVYPCRGGNRTG